MISKYLSSRKSLNIMFIRIPASNFKIICEINKFLKP